MINIQQLKDSISKYQDSAINIAQNIWNYAELSYEEVKSSNELINALQKEGFTIEKNIANIPTAFTATFTNGQNPIKVALLAEYDALDGLSQVAALPEEQKIDGKTTGHGCGHNLLGAGCYLAAVALKNYITKNNLNLSIVFFGCPAEEGAGSKQFIARAGYFDNIDFAISWHPDYINCIQSKGNVAIFGANFIFDGIASHAGDAPELGRSALDACELMNVGCNYLREHMLDKARVHYAYSNAGGTAPNVVQSHAVIKYEVRAPKISEAKDLFSRVVNIAKGAALMTDTTMRYEITMAFSDFTPNITLSKIANESLKTLGTPEFDNDDLELAKHFIVGYNKNAKHAIEQSLLKVFDDIDIVHSALASPLHQEIIEFNEKEKEYNAGSTDVGDVGYATPTILLRTACAALGTPGHSWQNTAFANSSIGMKGMIKAAEVMTYTILSILAKPENIEIAKKELLKKNGGQYICPLPDNVDPPIGKY